MRKTRKHKFSKKNKNYSKRNNNYSKRKRVRKTRKHKRGGFFWSPTDEEKEYKQYIKNINPKGHEKKYSFKEW